MARTNCNSNSSNKKTPRTERFYTVGYAPNQGRDDPAPQISIKGHWLREFGFDTGEKLTAKVMNGCIVITCQTASLKEAERRLEKLKAAEQRLKEIMLSY